MPYFRNQRPEERSDQESVISGACAPRFCSHPQSLTTDYLSLITYYLLLPHVPAPHDNRRARHATRHGRGCVGADLGTRGGGGGGSGDRRQGVGAGAAERPSLPGEGRPGRGDRQRIAHGFSGSAQLYGRGLRGILRAWRRARQPRGVGTPCLPAGPCLPHRASSPAARFSMASST